MKPKLAFLGLFVVVVIVFVVLSRNSSRRANGPGQSLVITQDGRITLQQQPNQYSTFVVIADKSKSDTNVQSSTNNSKTK